MAGPALALQYLLLLLWFAGIFLVLCYTVIRWRNLKKSIPPGLLFLALSVLSGYIYYQMKQDQHLAAQQFLGYYKLTRLDRKDCNNCKVKLNSDYRYEIFVNNAVVGQGKWKLETAIDIPGVFAKIENGPSVVWEYSRTIDFIDRIPE